MIEKKFISMKKNEFAIKEFIKKMLGKGKISDVQIERTPIGEKIIISTSRPGLVIGRGGEIIQELTRNLKEEFKLENIKIEILEIEEMQFDAQTVADQIALSLERFGPSSFKMITYRALNRIKQAGALGAEIILSGKLPSEKAKSWWFHFGYLKKTGEIEIVNKAKTTAKTKPGVIGIKVAIVPREAKIPDRIDISNEIIEETIEIKKEEPEEKEEKPKEKKKRKKAK